MVLDVQYLRNYRLSELASLAGVHRVHLVREFRKNYGMTIGQHIRRLRIGHACDLRASTDLLLRDIAATCRFVDQSHFSKQFKELSGLTTVLRSGKIDAQTCIVALDSNCRTNKAFPSLLH